MAQSCPPWLCDWSLWDTDEDASIVDMVSSGAEDNFEITLPQIVAFPPHSIRQEAIRLTALLAYNRGEVHRAASLLDLSAKDCGLLQLRLATRAVLQICGPAVWNAERGYQKTRKRIEMQIDQVLVGVFREMGSSDEVGDLCDVSTSTAQRILRTTR
jgi:hypothetical protein